MPITNLQLLTTSLHNGDHFKKKKKKKKKSACFALSLRIILLLHPPFLFLGTSFMEVILWKVLRQRSIYGSLLKNWWITEAVLMNGSMSKTEPLPSDILTVCKQLLASSCFEALHINR